LVLVGGVSAFVAALTLLWLVLMATLPAPARDSTGGEELAFIASHDRQQIAKFLPTTLVAFAYG